MGRGAERAARSVRYFSFYLFAVGITLILAPNLLLSTVAMPVAKEIWIRILGWLLVVIGSWYRLISSRSDVQLLQWTVSGRLASLTFLSSLVLMRLAPPMLLLFGAVDGAGALWTLACLKARHSAPQDRQ